MTRSAPAATWLHSYAPAFEERVFWRFPFKMKAMLLIKLLIPSNASALS